MSEHTPTPYHVGMRPGPIVYGPSGEMVADCCIITNTSDENKAIAAFIVKACNSHEELLEACKFLQPLAIKHAPQGISEEYWETAFDKLEKAIRKAEEE